MTHIGAARARKAAALRYHRAFNHEAASPCMRLFIALLAALVLTGCQITNQNVARVTGDYTAAVKKAGLLSIVGERPTLGYLTSSAMESNFAQADLPGWNADAIVQKQVGAQLKHKRIDAQILPRMPALAKIYGTDRNYANNDEIRAAIEAIGAERGLDLVVVVCDKLDNDTVTNTHQMIRGYGVQRALTTPPMAYASLYVEAIDLKNHFVIAKAGGKQSQPLPESVWQSEFEKNRGVVPIAPDGAETIRTTLERVLANAAATAAQEAGF